MLLVTVWNHMEFFCVWLVRFLHSFGIVIDTSISPSNDSFLMSSCSFDQFRLAAKDRSTLIVCTFLTLFSDMGVQPWKSLNATIKNTNKD